MLSRKAKYALQALLLLAREFPSRPVPAAQIAARQRIPKKFLELILLELKHHGLVHSLRGRSGGYRLARSPERIMLSQIIRVIDGPLAPLPCVSRTAFAPCEDCVDVERCEIRRVMQHVRDAMALILDRTSLIDALEGRHALPENLTYELIE